MSGERSASACISGLQWASMADSEERIARSRERERQYQMLVRTGKVADYLP